MTFLLEIGVYQKIDQDDRDIVEKLWEDSFTSKD